MGEKITAIVNAAVKLVNEDTKQLINVFLFAFIPIVFVLGLMLLMHFVTNTIDAMGDPTEKCWDVSKIEETVYLVNQCTGEVKDITKNSSQ